jgi:hypothetical protein
MEIAFGVDELAAEVLFDAFAFTPVESIRPADRRGQEKWERGVNCPPRWVGPAWT